MLFAGKWVELRIITLSKINQAQKNEHCNWALVAHACNPSYSGGRDQFEANPEQVVHKTLSQKYTFKKGLAEWLKW
jgi:hypothetical protein